MKLTYKQRLLVAMTLFGMFFGAGNLIFPVHLGQLAGRNAFEAMVGFIITAVTLPVLAVAAIGFTHSDGLQKLADKAGKKYSLIFTCILYLTIGPLFAIPRCATTSFTTGIAPLWNSPYALLIFSFIFFLIAGILSLKPGKITLYIGRIINPVFLAFYSILLFCALLNPSASVSSILPESSYMSGSLFKGLVEGYGTMDTIAGLAFGIVVIDVIRKMGVEKKEDIAKEVLSSGLIAGMLMALIYVLSIVMGAQSRGLFELSENGGIALAQISSHYLGKAGTLILAVTITSACLKTTIGLITSCSDTFERMSHGRISYRVWAVGFTLVSFLIANFGLSAIISWSIPVLMLIYPPSITLVLLALTGKIHDHDTVVYRWTLAFVWPVAFLDFWKALPYDLMPSLTRVLTSISAMLPFSAYSLGWLLPAMVGLCIGMLIKRRKCVE